MFLSVCPEVRCLIYKFVYQQPEGELLGLSKEPAHEYDHGLPSDWIADSGQRGLVYGSDTDRTEPTNSRFLRTCRLINSEATPIFYGANTIILYAEDNNDIFIGSLTSASATDVLFVILRSIGRTGSE